MRNLLSEKALIIGIILLFIGASIVPITSANNKTNLDHSDIYKMGFIKDKNVTNLGPYYYVRITARLLFTFTFFNDEYLGWHVDFNTKEGFNYVNYTGIFTDNFVLAHFIFTLPSC